MGAAPSEVFSASKLHIHVYMAVPHFEELLSGVTEPWIRRVGLETCESEEMWRLTTCSQTANKFPRLAKLTGNGFVGVFTPQVNIVEISGD